MGGPGAPFSGGRPPDVPLPASFVVPLLVRQVHAAGGFAVVLVKGSPFGGALVVVHRAPGVPGAQQENIEEKQGEEAFSQPVFPVAYELSAGLSGRCWRVAAAGESAVERFCASQQKFDPDIWIVELAVGDIKRFIVEVAPFC